jgi:hypothetical protein
MRTPWTALAFLLVFLTASCQKSEVPPTGPLRLEKSTLDDAIPLQYGDLVAVTSGAQDAYVLWFVKPDKSIVALGVNGARRNVSTGALIIPRR